MLTYQMPYTTDATGNLSSINKPRNIVRLSSSDKANTKPAVTKLACEIRSPLTSIGLSLELLEPNITDPGQKVYIDIIKRSSVQINHLVGLLLRADQ